MTGFMQLGSIFYSYTKTICWGFIVLTSTVMLGACGSITGSGINMIGANVTPIRDLSSDLIPNQEQTTVYVQGKVIQRVPLVKKYAYQIDDNTGKIWVLTEQNNLKVNSQVVIKGQLRYQSISFEGQNFGEIYLEEK
ncbi:hypothetical protein NIES3974_37810 [Calothrix sp. NIES-3974]|nr:hypothetical protein NIES3974_37810 [Calothrix sp. NIES-3974]